MISARSPVGCVMADDLSGSLDTAVQFTRVGVRVGVLCDLREARDGIGSWDVIVINAESRAISPEQARRRVTDLFSAHHGSGIRHFYKKTDSCLRGNVGAELGDQAELSVTCCGPDGLDAALAEAGGDGLGDDAAGGTIVVVDAWDDDQLKEVARSVRRSAAGVPLAGCAGFARWLPSIWGIGGVSATDPPEPPNRTRQSRRPAGVTLFVVGSCAIAARAQVDSLIAQGIPCLIPGVQEPARLTALLSRNGGNVLVTTPVAERPTGTEAVEALARFVAAAAPAAERCTLVVVGGDTLAALSAALGITAIEPTEEIEPGVVACEEVGGGYRLITKAGTFGDEDTLLRVAQGFETQGSVEP